MAAGLGGPDSGDIMINGSRVNDILGNRRDVITKDIPDYDIVAGILAKIIRCRFETD